jgi:hypothetical protein
MALKQKGESLGRCYLGKILEKKSKVRLLRPSWAWKLNPVPRFTSFWQEPPAAETVAVLVASQVPT